MRLDRPDDALLLAAGDARERVSDARTDRPGVDTALDGGREVDGEREPVLDPPRAPAQEAGDRRLADARALEERLDHARLVHGRDRAAWRVRDEDQGKDLLGRALALHDDWHLAAALGAPPFEPAEAVHQLEAVLVCHGAEGEVGEAVRVRAPEGASERSEARPHLLDRHEADELPRGRELGHGRGLSARELRSRSRRPAVGSGQNGVRAGSSRR